MQRVDATKLLRALLDEHGLNHWRIRLSMDVRGKFLGFCSHKDNCIILNAHHIDTHPDDEVTDTIKHEVARALCGPNVAHGPEWQEKAKQVGARPIECGFLSVNPAIVDALRSGADVEVTFEEYTVKTPKYTVTRLQDKCPTCGKVAKEKSSIDTTGLEGNIRIIFLECGHQIVKVLESQSPFEKLIFDGDSTCNHTWNKTKCIECGAKRLYPFQIEGARALENAGGRLALFDEMGLGKTIQALAFLAFKKEERWPFLWVTKAGTMYQHLKEIVRVLGDTAIPYPLTKGTMKPVKGLNHIASYDVFRRMDMSVFAEAGFKTIVLDECQAIKNPDSQRTKAIRILAKHIPSVIPMSGTFWKNRGSEAFVVLNLLDPTKFWSFKDFRDRYVTTYWDGAREKEGGLKKDFLKGVTHIAIRRERTEVLPELPLVNRTEIKCEVPAHAREIYNQEADALVRDLQDAVLEGRENSFQEQGSILQHLVVMRQVVGIAKVDTTVEYAKEFLEETDRKLVVFVHHIKCGELILGQLTKWCAENDFPQPLSLSAALSPEERSKVQDLFNGPSSRLLIASTQASGEGLNLQTCSDCVMHERQWNPANEEQAEGRFIRIGQMANSVNAVYIHGDDTIDTDLNDIVERKRVQFHVSMNKGEMPTWVQVDIVKELARRIAEKRRKEVK